LGNNATDGVTIGYSRLPFADADGSFSTTTTSERYAAISTITNATSTDSYVNIGRFAATLSAGAGYAWTVPTFTALNLINRPIFSTRLLTFTAVWTNLSVGDGTATYIYKIENSSCEYNVGLILGSTSSVSGSVSHTLPFSRSSSYGGTGTPQIGLVKLNDANVGGYIGGNVMGTTTSTLLAYNSATTYVAQSAFQFLSVPFIKGFKAVEEYNTAIASMAAMVVTFGDNMKGLSLEQQWRGALSYSEKIIPVLT